MVKCLNLIFSINNQNKESPKHHFNRTLKTNFSTFVTIYKDYCDELELVKERDCDLKLALFGANILNNKKFF